MSHPPVTIKVRENGPYIVKGPVKLVDADGCEYTSERDTIALCRCGGSTTKPFCDGTHSKTGFTAAERAVQSQVDTTSDVDPAATAPSADDPEVPSGLA